MRMNGSILMMTALLFITGCGRENGEIAAYVNKEPVFKSELKREIALRAKQDPTFKVTPEVEARQLELMINRKLIVQKAMEMGLAREERFVNTIKSFWEQTLIRDFLEHKKMQLANYLYAAEDEIKRYYDDLSERTTFKVVKTKNRAEMEEVYRNVVENKEQVMASCETVGPVGCEEITSDALQQARSMSVGETGRFEDGPYYYVIKVDKKERVALRPLEELKPEIEKRVMERKEKALFDTWLKEEKARARITIFRPQTADRRPQTL